MTKTHRLIRLPMHYQPLTRWRPINAGEAAETISATLDKIKGTNKETRHG